MSSVEGKRFISVDPGENCGFSIWHGERMVGGGQLPLWEFAHHLWDALAHNIGPLSSLSDEMLDHGVSVEETQPSGENTYDLIVCEKFALYPWKAKELAFDEFRTVQLIGAITFMAALHGVELHKQPATIKERAMDGGAGDLFISPLRENRHRNDATMHAFFYVAVECKGINLGVKDGTSN